MKTLHLNVKKQWFDMILAGEKKEEYREYNRYWESRIRKALDRHAETVTFSNGYQKNRRQVVVELIKVSAGEGVVEWGAEESKVYTIIHLGKIIKKINC